MADEIDDADAIVRTHVGFENDNTGKLIAKLLRHVRMLTVVVRDLKTRVDRLDPPS